MLTATQRPTMPMTQNHTHLSTELVRLPGDLSRAISRAIELLGRGEIAVVPTETIYGLCCRADKASSVAKLFAVKGRDLAKVSAVFVASPADIERYAFIEHAAARSVIDKLLPGPLTVILRSRIKAMPGVVGADDLIGFRVSSDPFVTQICRNVGAPLIATSANKSGGPDCRTEQEIIEAFEGAVPLIVLHGDLTAATPSTVVDLSREQPRLVRQGTVPFAEVLKLAES